MTAGMVALLALGMLATPAPAQTRNPSAGGGPLEYISRGDRRVIRTQIDIAIRAAEMARETLGRGTETEDLTRAKELARKSYTFLRYAMHGVEIIVNDDEREGYEKVAARLALTAINEARGHNLAAQKAIDNSIPWLETREQYVAEAIRDLTDSLPGARKATMFLPR
jgi:hypothetical protein